MPNRTKQPESERLLQMTQIEQAFWSAPQCVTAGMDEVGRGPLAGPVVAGCVVLPPEPLIAYVNDSKKVTPLRRERLYPQICEAALTCATGWVSADIIDRDNILQATKAAFCQAFFLANQKLPITDVLLDAMDNLAIPARQHSFVHGDALSYLIAAASIVAKVERDRYMVEMDALYPQYGFAKNKGYGTREHIEALKKYGPCPIHRRSFIRNFLQE